ncbi:beta family protein [Pseudomonas sp. RA_15y_Pfl2_54]|uniref:beta family protein n=1 Tax=Pseudomonas sp. RA_15y_Pfl2_54 TaxID=3088704 RepID=UPI0030D86637
MDWNNFVYFPVLKTKDAELKAITSIDKNTREKTLPIYEITKSRITKKNSLGDIAKRLDQIRTIQNGLPFILDVSTDPKQINEQIENILSPEEGYRFWREWLETHNDLLIVPVIHINFDDDEDLSEAKKFVISVARNHPKMALRLPTDLSEEEYRKILSTIIPALGESKLFILLDDGCIRSPVKDSSIFSVAQNYQSAFDKLINLYTPNTWLEKIVCIAGSFPQLVKKEGKGDESGNFDIYEHGLYLHLKDNRPRMQFGDYASINISQIEMRGGTFVPRIDFCTDDKFFYYRKRRESGSYTWCAKQVIADANFANNYTWGDNEIFSAALGTPSGISPSFWISVRACNYMTRRAKILSI